MTNYIERICKHCGIKFNAIKGNVLQGFGNYCSKGCSNSAKPRGFKKGHKGYLTKEQHKQIALKRIGHTVSKETRDKISKANTGRIMPQELRDRLSRIHIERWDRIGRKPKKINERFKDYKYIKWRKNVFQRDRFICQMCGQVGGKLEADHIKEWVNYPELRYVLDNGRTLCKLCHAKTPNYKNKAKRK